MYKAFALGPNTVKEMPEAANKSNLEDYGTISPFIGEALGIIGLHGLAPLRRNPSLKDIQPPNSSLFIDGNFKCTARHDVRENARQWRAKAHQSYHIVGTKPNTMDHHQTGGNPPSGEDGESFFNTERYLTILF